MLSNTFIYNPSCPCTPNLYIQETISCPAMGYRLKHYSEKTEKGRGDTNLTLSCSTGGLGNVTG
jgi:hypothetical protein